MNICEKTQMKMLEGLALSAEDQQHLKSCPDCREFAAFAERMKQLPVMEQEVPAYLDEKILEAASEAVPKKHWTPVIWKIAVPLAAAFAFVSGLMFYGTGEKDIVPSVAKKISSTGKKSAVTTVAAVKRDVKDETVLEEELFDEQVFALAVDVGYKWDSVSESIESVSDTMDII